MLWLTQSNPDVSILVLVDVALEHDQGTPISRSMDVSILVLVDVALEPSMSNVFVCNEDVSILVLVDVALEHRRILPDFGSFAL